MNKSANNDWQKPFVDVFKKFKVFDSTKEVKKGQVVDVQDNFIGRKIFQIKGSVSAVNNLTIPDPNLGFKTLGLTGRYVYLEFLATKGQSFMIHLDFNIKDFEPIVRFSISNLYDQYKVIPGNTVLQIPFPKDAPEKWTIMVLDVQLLLANSGIFKNSTVKQFNSIHTFRSATICSFLSFRGIYTTDSIYEIETLPKELNFKPAKDKNWNKAYQMCYYPNEADPEAQRDNQKFQNDQQLLAVQPQEDSEDQIAYDVIKQSSINEMKKSLKTTDFIEPQQSSGRKQDIIENEEKPVVLEQQQQIQEINLEDSLEKQHIDEKSHGILQFNKFKQPKAQMDGLKPDPILRLKHTIGYSVKQCADIRWSRMQDLADEIIYASGCMLISFNVKTFHQRFFMGHLAPISCIDVSRDGQWIVSAQQGSQSYVKIWDFKECECIGSFQCPYTNIKCISLSFDKSLLCTVGSDNHNRELIIIWNVSGFQGNQQDKKYFPTVLAKQISDFNITSMKFSPVELDQLVSCGKENIRFWRIKNAHLPAYTVVLKQHARNTMFTVFDFEFAFEDSQASQQITKVNRVFVGSQSGMLYQVNYDTRVLETVYKCHESSICSLSVGVGFCISGSEDMYLRVWPLDFSEFNIEAKHEGILTSLDISLDSLKVVCGTSTGGLGILDLVSNDYKTILRSHTDEIIQAEYHKFSKLLITLSADLTIRLWNLERYEQVYEFTYPSDDQATCISTYPNGMFFAAGFTSGVFRIFDIEKIAIVEECKYHEAPITAIQYSLDGSHLIIGDKSSIYTVYDTQRAYQTIKQFDQEKPSEFQSIAYAPNQSFFATIGDSGTHINIYDTVTLQNILKIFVPNIVLKKLKFSNDGVELFALAGDCRIKTFAIQHLGDLQVKAYLYKELMSVHRSGIEDIAMGNNYQYLVTVGGDSLVKVWDYDFLLEGPGSNQFFLGHINKINNVLFYSDNEIITTGGFEGIYQWEFLGDNRKAERNVNFESLKMGPQKAIVGLSKSKVLTTTEDEEKVLEEQKKVMQYQEQGENGNEKIIKEEQQYQINYSYEDEEGKEEEQEKVLMVKAQQQQQQQMMNDDDGNNDGLLEKVQDEKQEMFKVTESEEDTEGNQKESVEQNKGILQDKLLDFGKKNKLKSVSSQQQDSNRKSAGQSDQQQFLTHLSMNKENKFTMHKKECNFQPKIIDYKRQSKKKEKRNIQEPYKKNETRTKFTLPFRQYFLEQMSTETENKVQKLIENPDSVHLDLMIGNNNDTHDNLIWNYVSGWFAYTVENMIIIEELNKDRKQKIIPMNDQISTIILSKDFKHLLVGSATYNSKDLANIYVLDCSSYKIVKTLQFHTRGVQNMVFSNDGKLLVTIGNFKECTVVVWEWPTGKIIASSYTLDKINDVKVSDKCYSLERQLEFVTVGRDQIQFWALTKDKKLEYYDVFVEKNEEQQLPELTAVDYIVHQDSQYAVVGLATGELVYVKYGEFKITHKQKLCNSEITGIYANHILNKIFVCTMEGLLFYWTVDKTAREFCPQFLRTKFSSGIASVAYEPLLNEGLVSLYKGGIHYFNIQDQYHSIIVGSVDQNVPYSSEIISDDFLLTFHYSGELKLWNIKTAEQVLGYSFRSRITAFSYNSLEQKLICYFANNNEIRIINVGKFGPVETYVENDYVDTDKKSTDYVIKAFDAMLAGKANKFALLKSGSLFQVEHIFKDNRAHIKTTKILELPDTTDLQVYQEKSLILHANSKGIIQTLLVDMISETENSFGFTIMDEFDIFDNAANDQEEGNNQEQTNQILNNSESLTKVAVSKINIGTYYAINSNLKVVVARNYLRRQIIHKYELQYYPICIQVYENKEEPSVIIGMENGLLQSLNQDNKEDIKVIQTMFSSQIKDICTRKNKKLVVVSTQSGIQFFKY